MRNWQGKAPGYADAKRNHQEHWQDRHHHDHDWWRHHCDAIVFVGGGFWGWYDGWWYPAWGYDPYYSYYDYNGRSMATMDFNPTTSLPIFRQRYRSWAIIRTRLMECWGRRLKPPSRITSATTGYRSRERSINQL
jgi:hypothetical protein